MQHDLCYHIWNQKCWFNELGISFFQKHDFRIFTKLHPMMCWTHCMSPNHLLLTNFFFDYCRFYLRFQRWWLKRPISDLENLVMKTMNLTVKLWLHLWLLIGMAFLWLENCDPWATVLYLIRMIKDDDYSIKLFQNNNWITDSFNQKITRSSTTFKWDSMQHINEWWYQM